MLLPVKRVSNDLISLQEAKKVFYKSELHKYYKRSLTLFLPWIGPSFYKVKFDVKHAERIANRYCKMTGLVRPRPIVTWQKKKWEDRPYLRMPWEVAAWTSNTDKKGWCWIIMNPVRYTGKNDYFMWRCFTHELAHLRQHNHDKNGFGLEVIRVMDFFKKHGKELVK